jgi:hypothetical protein
VIILLPSCVTITLTSSAAEDWAITGEVSLLTLFLSAVTNTCKEENVVMLQSTVVHLQ